MSMLLNKPWKHVAQLLNSANASDNQKALVRKAWLQNRTKPIGRKSNRRQTIPHSVQCRKLRYRTLSCIWMSLLDTGMELSHAFAVDKDPDLCKFTTDGLGTGLRNADCMQLDYSKLGHVDVFQWRPPCIPWSSAGSLLGANHSDAEIWLSGRNYIRQCEPNIWLYENVAHLATKKIRPVLLEMLRCFRKRCNSLYQVHVMVLDNKSHGDSPMLRNKGTRETHETREQTQT